MRKDPGLPEKEDCRLCGTLSPLFYISKKKRFFQCPNCKGVFASQHFLPNDKTEIYRYEAHNNDVTDPRYRKFVSPITSRILKDFKSTDRGLDFGSGTGPVITTVLRENEYDIETYDPYFDNRPEVLNNQYHYIASCEVIEHFHDPLKEFQNLKKLLLPNGKLYLMTDPFSEDVDFQNWYYKNDPTHVFLYHNESFQWIKEHIGFEKLEIDGRLITYSI